MTLHDRHAFAPFSGWAGSVLAILCATPQHVTCVCLLRARACRRACWQQRRAPFTFLGVSTQKRCGLHVTYWLLSRTGGWRAPALAFTYCGITIQRAFNTLHNVAYILWRDITTLLTFLYLVLSLRACGGGTAARTHARAAHAAPTGGRTSQPPEF